MRFLKNIAGLWLLQECRRAWAGGQRNTLRGTGADGRRAKPFCGDLDPDAFLEPGDMPADRRVLPPPDRRRRRLLASIARTILESLALRYRQVLEDLSVGRAQIGVIHIVGGGSRNALLNQFVADCTGRVW